MASSLVKTLIKVAKAILQAQVIAVVNTQLNMVEQEVRTVMQRHVQEVVGGMWQGDGAQRFVDEIVQDAIPTINRTVEVVRTTNHNIEIARDTLIDADNRVKTAVDRISDAFQNI